MSLKKSQLILDVYSLTPLTQSFKFMLLLNDQSVNLVGLDAYGLSLLIEEDNDCSRLIE